jgi:hypothetical protein
MPLVGGVPFVRRGAPVVGFLTKLLDRAFGVR